MVLGFPIVNLKLFVTLLNKLCSRLKLQSKRRSFITNRFQVLLALILYLHLMNCFLIWIVFMACFLKAVKQMKSNLLALLVAAVGFATGGLITYKLLNRRRTSGSIRDLYDDNAESCKGMFGEVGGLT